jgi:hypothetical protein
MTTTTSTTTTFDVDALRRAVEGRDADGQLALYAPDAVIRTVDEQHGPSAPLTLEGAGAIGAYLRDVCDRDMTHTVSQAIATDDRLAFEVRCAYPDGTRVLCQAIARLDGGRIVEQTGVQAWDH